MGSFSASQIFRDYATEGVPSSGPYEPQKSLIRQYLLEMETLVAAMLTGQSLVYQTRADLFADLAHGAATGASVLLDPTAAYNGVYRKSGASGSGSWSRIADLPNSVLSLTVTGGTQNAIEATSTLPIPVSDSTAVIVLFPTATNTGPVTLTINGASAVPLNWLDGTALRDGDLVAGVPVMIFKRAGSYRLAASAGAQSISSAAAVTSMLEKTLTWAYAIVDDAGRVAGGWDTKGVLRLFKPFPVPSQSWLDDDATTPIIDRVLPPNLTVTPEEETSHVYAFGIADLNDKLKFAIPLHGDIVGRIQEASLAHDIAAPAIEKVRADEIVPELIGGSLFAHNRTTGDRVLMSSSSPSNPYVVDGKYIAYTVAGVQKYKPAAGGTEYPVFPASKLTLWGDSLTYSPTGVSNVGSVLGITTQNGGAPGYASADIAIWQGGLRPKLTVTGNEIPASGPVTVTAIWPTTGYSPWIDTTFTGSLAGVPGTLTRPVATKVWTFTRTTPGSAVSCPAQTEFISSVAAAAESDIQSLWMGRNDIVNQTCETDVIENMARCVAFLKPLYKRYCVISVTNGQTEGLASANYAKIRSINAKLKAIYGGRFYDLRADFIANGLTTAGVTPTSGDLAAIADDRPPPSLMADDIHPNATGYAAQKTLFAAWLTSKGFFA